MTKLTKRERMAYVKAGLKGYAKLNENSQMRTSREAWIALKLGCTEAQARKYIGEAEASP